MGKIHLPILMYHRLSENRLNDRYAVSVDNFKEQTEYLYKNGFKSVLPNDIKDLLEANFEKPIMITFDDAYETDYSFAYPLLKKYGFRAVYFITTSYIGKDGYISWAQLEALKNEGFSIQSHTHSHSFLNLINYKGLEDELYTSKQLIEVRLGVNVNSLSLPGGGFNKNVKRGAQEAGYQYIFSSKPGLNAINNVPQSIFHRIPITRDTTVEKFKNIVNLNSQFYQQALLSYFAKNIIKTLIGPKRYHYLWSRHFK